jgi:hypothetical protein
MKTQAEAAKEKVKAENARIIEAARPPASAEVEAIRNVEGK